MPINKSNLVSRRQFIAKTSLASAALWLGFNRPLVGNIVSAIEKPNSKIAGVQLGVITYSFRSMPGNAVQLLQYCIDSNVNAIELIGDAVEEYAGKPVSPIKFVPGQQLTDEQKEQMSAYRKQVAEWRATVSMDKFEAFRKLYNNSGITVYAFKPRLCLEPTNSDAEIEYAMRGAKALGANCVTVELPTDSAHCQRLGDVGSKHKIYVGYHAHTQATDTSWDVALSQSPYNSINLDCGHYIAAGGKNTSESLLALIEKRADRITSLHMKDRKSKSNGEINMPWGEGDTPIKEVLNLIKNKKFKFPVTIELEYDIPFGSDAVKETRRCLEFAKKILVG